MVRRSTPRRDEAERAFGWQVDVPVPPLGLGERLTQMHDWCTRLIGPAGGALWDEHGHSAGFLPNGAPRDWCRFYFAIERDAVAFERVWGGVLRRGPDRAR